MNNRFHSEAKQPWSYDFPLANHIATNKSSAANREIPLFSRLYPSFGLSSENFLDKGFKILPIGHSKYTHVRSSDLVPLLSLLENIKKYTKQSHCIFC